MKKLICALMLCASIGAQAQSLRDTCASAAGAVRALADRRDEGMSKMQAIDRIRDFKPDDQAAAMVLIDWVWSYPRVSGLKMSNDLYQKCVAQAPAM